MSLNFTYTSDTRIPVEIEGLIPSAVRGKTLDEIRQHTIFHGNEKLPLAEMFQVEGDAKSVDWHFHGNLSGVHWIGAHLDEGTIHVHGNAGRHVGSEMQGGSITVDGDAGDWVGGEMRRGLIRVSGSAGHLIGAAYRGSRVGMKGGTILIGSNAGNEIGHTMRRGWIVIGGNAGDMIGFNMLAGSVLVMGECGIRPGAGMRRGTLGLFGAPRPQMLPTFKYACRQRPLVLQLMSKQLRDHGWEHDLAPLDAEVDLFHGDMLDGGRGEVMMPAE